jgi:hypothetical protein
VIRYSVLPVLGPPSSHLTACASTALDAPEAISKIARRTHKL